MPVANLGMTNRESPWAHGELGSKNSSVVIEDAQSKLGLKH